VKVQPFGPLDPSTYRETVRRALAEDLGWGDVTTESTVPPDLFATAILLAKSPTVLAGLDIAEEAFRQLDPRVQVTRHLDDGEWCAPGTRVATFEGTAAALLTAERTALNFLQRLSGIATQTRRFVEAAAGRVTILDTRKTTPTLRVLEKYAVRAGGGTNHRMALDDGILIKDNHIRLAGGIGEAWRRAATRALDLPIEVEAQSMEQLTEALDAGATRILVDNFPDEALPEIVRLTRGRATLEVSGGVTFERLERIAAAGVDFVSIGALTHSVVAADLSLEIEPSNRREPPDVPAPV
jgi:nicotinate-nucleotide pyrophosphorylase (carboxylating)